MNKDDNFNVKVTNPTDEDLVEANLDKINSQTIREAVERLIAFKRKSWFK